MDLCISFQGEMVPFIMNMATEAECLRAIEIAKKDFLFNRNTAVVKNDRSYLHAIPRHAKKKRRLYCLNDKVIWDTDTQCPDEVASTKELLAYENHVNPSDICVVEY